jgi:hypothetical protein
VIGDVCRRPLAKLARRGEGDDRDDLEVEQGRRIIDHSATSVALFAPCPRAPSPLSSSSPTRSNATPAFFARENLGHDVWEVVVSPRSS